MTVSAKLQIALLAITVSLVCSAIDLQPAQACQGPLVYAQPSLSSKITGANVVMTSKRVSRLHIQFTFSAVVHTAGKVDRVRVVIPQPGRGEKTPERYRTFTLRYQGHGTWGGSKRMNFITRGIVAPPQWKQDDLVRIQAASGNKQINSLARLQHAGILSKKYTAR